MQENNYYLEERFISITCSIYISIEADTWLHVLLKCNHHHIHAIKVNRHSKKIWELRKLFLSSQNLDGISS